MEYAWLTGLQINWKYILILCSLTEKVLIPSNLKICGMSFKLGYLSKYAFCDGKKHR
jgi:hypothetical protein